MSELPSTDEASLAARRVLTAERSPESGTNWRIERQVITPERPSLAVGEIGNLLGSRRSKVTGRQLWLRRPELGNLVTEFGWVQGSRNLRSFFCTVEPDTNRD